MDAKWITNSPPERVANDLAELRPYNRMPFSGEPKGTAKCSVSTYRPIKPLACRWTWTRRNSNNCAWRRYE